jgi:hypothetical protein
MKQVAKNVEGYRRARRNILKAAVLAGGAAPGILGRARPAKAITPHPCFLRGTNILTAQGEQKVENLAVGDRLPAVFGGTRPIEWIGRYRVRRTDVTRPWIDSAKPVRIARSAITENVPNTDLFVTRHHSLLIDGFLVPAGYLVNGVTITLFDPGESDEIEFFHIKLAAHDVIYAAGTPCESLLQVDEKSHNFVDYIRTHGSLEIDEKPCAPGVGHWSGRVELKSRLRSSISPWIDGRQQLDIIRDRLEERAIALTPQAELVS